MVLGDWVFGDVLKLKVSVRWIERADKPSRYRGQALIYICSRGPQVLEPPRYLTAGGRPVTYRGIISSIHGALASGYPEVPLHPLTFAVFSGWHAVRLGVGDAFSIALGSTSGLVTGPRHCIGPVGNSADSE
jgi:hypothetical protein